MYNYKSSFQDKKSSKSMYHNLKCQHMYYKGHNKHINLVVKSEMWHYGKHLEFTVPLIIGLYDKHVKTLRLIWLLVDLRSSNLVDILKQRHILLLKVFWILLLRVYSYPIMFRSWHLTALYSEIYVCTLTHPLNW